MPGRLGAFGLLILIELIALPATAQVLDGVSGSFTLASEDRFRGRAVSQERPTATLDLAYDAGNGLYLGGVAKAVAAPVGPRALGGQVYAGYARRLESGPGLDAGVVYSSYTDYYRGLSATQYGEAYVGLFASGMSARLYYSPNYFDAHIKTVYAELEGALHPADQWRLTGHLGLLTVIRGKRPLGVATSQYDWRLGLARTLSAYEVQLAWTGAGPDPDYYAGRPHSRQAAVLSVSRRF